MQNRSSLQRLLPFHGRVVLQSCTAFGRNIACLHSVMADCRLAGAAFQSCQMPPAQVQRCLAHNGFGNMDQNFRPSSPKPCCCMAGGEKYYVQDVGRAKGCVCKRLPVQAVFSPGLPVQKVFVKKVFCVKGSL